MWGQEVADKVCIKNTGIIPTRVGTRICVLLHSRFPWDHPHACGDKSFLKFPTIVRLGSSPRVWGQGYAEASWHRQAGIIPTRVGTSSASQARAAHSRDHPHACGDKVCAVDGYHNTLGSSPRVWGQGMCCRRLSQHLRIIPTRVGTRFGTLRLWRILRDHPHACGDKVILC